VAFGRQECATVTVRQRRQTAEEIHDLGSLHLYREDLRAIAVAAAEAGDLRITGTDASGTTYEGTTPDDLDEMPEKVSLVLSAVRPQAAGAGNTKPTEVTVRLLRDATVELTEPDTLTAGILFRIRQVCESRQRWLRGHMPRTGTFGFALMVPVLKPTWTSTRDTNCPAPWSASVDFPPPRISASAAGCPCSMP
jgi:hypothetical protein